MRYGDLIRDKQRPKFKMQKKLLESTSLEPIFLEHEDTIRSTNCLRIMYVLINARQGGPELLDRRSVKLSAKDLHKVLEDEQAGKFTGIARVGESNPCPRRAMGGSGMAVAGATTGDVDYVQYSYAGELSDRRIPAAVQHCRLFLLGVISRTNVIADRDTSANDHSSNRPPPVQTPNKRFRNSNEC